MTTFTFDADSAHTWFASGEAETEAEEFTLTGGIDDLYDLEQAVNEAFNQGFFTPGYMPMLWRVGFEDAGALITLDLPNGLRLSSTHVEMRHLFDRDQPSGVKAIMAALTAVAAEAASLVDRYERATALGDPTGAKTWPDSETEREAFADWQHEVGNGDTTLGFRDWVARRSA